MVMTHEMWEKIREAARTAARGTYQEALDSQRGALLGERLARDTAEAASRNYDVKTGYGFAAARAAGEAHRAALKALALSMANVKAHEVCQTEWSARDRWWGWCDVDGDAWAAVRRFMK